MGAKPRAFKHQLGSDRVASIAASIAAVSAEFDHARFLECAQSGLEGMELKARVRHIIATLVETLPQPFPRAIAAIRAAASHDAAIRQGDARVLRGFAAWPLIDYVGAHGLEHLELALESLAELTELFSAEFAIRPFLDQHPVATLTAVTRFTTSPDEHVRRLASEGTRPLLPWGMRLGQFRADPTPVLDILERLKNDSSEYVRRSVANNLNDIAKDHPRRVVDICARWLDEGVDSRLVRRALRSLVKNGDAGALGLLGYSSEIEAGIGKLTIEPPSVREGDDVELHFEIDSRSKGTQRINIDYAVHYVKARGRSAKVFKLKQLELGPGEKRVVRKKHSMKPVTTRVHYPGTHTIELLVNGKAMARADFELVG